MAKGKHAKPRRVIARRGVHAKAPGRHMATAVGYPLAFAAVCALAIGPGYAIATEAGVEAAAEAAKASGQASDTPVASSKDETVYVFAKADGSVKNVEVSDKLTNADKSSELADSSTLANIENVEGDEPYRRSGTDMVWDAQGSDICYRGDSDAELPIEMNVLHRLDGRAVPADELAGASGKVEIAYSFQNNTEAEGGVQVPFAAITGILLDSDLFSDIEVDNGKVIDDGDRVVVVGYAMPGLAESLDVDAGAIDIPSGFTVTAQATGFELGSTLTMVTGNLFDSVNMDDLDTGELTDASSSLKDAMSQLADGAGQLADGANHLADGTAAMRDKASALPDGVQQLYDGSSKLTDGLGTAASGTEALVSGISSLNAGVARLSGGLSNLSDGANDLDDSLVQISTGASALADESEGVPTAVAAVSAIADDVPAMTKEDIGRLKAAVSASVDDAADAGQINGLLDYAYSAGMGITVLSDPLDGVDEQTRALAHGASLASASAQSLAEGIDGAEDGASQLAAGAERVFSGATQLDSNMSAIASGSEAITDGLGTLSDSAGSLIAGVQQLVDGTAQLASGTTSLKDGLARFNDEGIVKITDFLDSDLVQTSDKLEAVRDAGESYDNFSGITEGTEGTVKFVIETDAIEPGD